MYKYYLIAFLVIINLGLIKLFLNYKSYRKTYLFCFEFRNKYVEFFNSYYSRNQFDNDLYFFLTKNSDKAQEILGVIGIVDYRPPYVSFMMKNYHFLVNTIPKFKTQIIHQSDATFLDDILTRKYGLLEEQMSNSKKLFYNPINWFQSGIQFILSLPINMLYWFGLINIASKNTITSNVFFSFFSNLVALVSFISGIVTIIVGKDAVIKLITNIF